MKENAKRIIDHYGIERQARQTMEKCAELIQALNKYLRIMNGDKTKEAKHKAMMDAAREIADVYIILLQLIEDFQFEKLIAEFLYNKINKTLERMKNVNN